jgi:hypothetical protein
MAEPSIHNLDKRVNSLEEWRDYMQTVDLPAMRETIKTEIPAHYTKRIQESEGNTMLRIGNLIDEKLDKRFGWMPRILEGVCQAIVIAAALYFLGLVG